MVAWHPFSESHHSAVGPISATMNLFIISSNEHIRARVCVREAIWSEPNRIFDFFLFLFSSSTVIRTIQPRSLMSFPSASLISNTMNRKSGNKYTIPLMNSTGRPGQSAHVHHTNHSLRWEEPSGEKRCERRHKVTRAFLCLCVCVCARARGNWRNWLRIRSQNKWTGTRRGSRFIDAYRRRSGKKKYCEDVWVVHVLYVPLCAVVVVRYRFYARWWSAGADARATTFEFLSFFFFYFWLSHFSPNRRRRRRSWSRSGTGTNNARNIADLFIIIFCVFFSSSQFHSHSLSVN